MNTQKNNAVSLLLKTTLTFSLGCAAIFSTVAQAADLPAASKAATKPTVVDQGKRFAAWKVAAMMGDKNFVALVQRNLAGKTKVDQPVMLNTLLTEHSTSSAAAKLDANALTQIDQNVRQYKGIAAQSKSVMEVCLYTPKNYTGRIDWKNLPVAYAPAGKKKEWKTVEAFDQEGHAYQLDARKAPAKPVLVVGLNGREAMRAGTAYVNQYLQDHGMQGKTPALSTSLSTTPSFATATPTYIDTTKLDYVRLKNDQEPWISGSAEIYAIVSGVQPNQAKAGLTIVDMPYLDNDNTDYRPNQILVFWSEYRYAAANIQLFEHDDNTNYKDLAVALVDGVNAILGVFAPTYAVIGQVAGAILKAMPANWFSNDDDYVDSFYTLEKGKTYTNYVGAGNNATVSLTPYRLLQQ